MKKAKEKIHEKKRNKKEDITLGRNVQYLYHNFALIRRDTMREREI